MAHVGQGGPPPPSSSDDSCTSDPNFAIMCAFVNEFGSMCGVACPTLGKLQEMLEDTSNVRDDLALFHVKLLRRLKKSVSIDKWERSVAKFAHTYSNNDGWELERFGYKKSKLSVKLRLLKNLLEAQFDGNQKFKSEINSKQAKELRHEPLGRDKLGNAYWWAFCQSKDLR